MRYRPTGSTPEIREPTLRKHPRSYSDSSQRPSGVRSHAIARPRRELSQPEISSSEYNSTTPSDKDPLPPGFPKKDPRSYEELLSPATTTLKSPHPHLAQPKLERKPGTRNLQPRLAAQSSPSLLRDQQPTSPRKGTRTPKPNPNPYRYASSTPPALTHTTPTINALPAHLMAQSTSSSSDKQSISPTPPLLYRSANTPPAAPTRTLRSMDSLPAQSKQLHSFPDRLAAQESGYKRESGKPEAM